MNTTWIARAFALAFSSLLIASPALHGCILSDDFLAVPDQFACVADSDCSEPGYVCRQDLCVRSGGAIPCTDEDDDGFGALGTDTSSCDSPTPDQDDTCAECTPIAPEICDGFDNDTNGMTDEPAACEEGAAMMCPPNSALPPAGGSWTCQEGRCVIRPPFTEEEVCRMPILCVNGVYDTAAQEAAGCFG